MVDLVQSGWAFAILMLSLASFFGIASYIYVGYVKGFPTVAGTKIWCSNWSKDVWTLILGRQRERAEKKQQEVELAKLAKELKAAHDSEVGIKRPPNACLRPNSYMSNNVMTEDIEAQYGAELGR